MGTATKSGISWRMQRGGGEATGGEEEVPHNREHLVQVPVTCAMTQAPGLETAWRDSPYQVGGEVDI